jgi:hypothetical protein
MLCYIVLSLPTTLDSCHSEQVCRNNGEDGKPIWMTYGGVVYDVTNFVYNRKPCHIFFRMNCILAQRWFFVQTQEAPSG